MEQLFQLFVEKILLVEIVEEKMIDLKIEQQHWDLETKLMLLKMEVFLDFLCQESESSFQVGFVLEFALGIQLVLSTTI